MGEHLATHCPALKTLRLGEDAKSVIEKDLVWWEIKHKAWKIIAAATTQLKYPTHALLRSKTPLKFILMCCGMLKSYLDQLNMIEKRVWSSTVSWFAGRLCEHAPKINFEVLYAPEFHDPAPFIGFLEELVERFQLTNTFGSLSSTPDLHWQMRCNTLGPLVE
jgi:hypothetical protein